MKRTLLAITLLASDLSVNAESDFPGVKRLMDVEQFEKTGLNKLSKEELEALNNWLAAYTANEAPVLKKTSEEVKKLARDEKIESHIVGKFNGWKGKTLFTLANGQVWKQRLSGKYYHRAENPSVEITKNRLGFYVMRVLDTGKTIGVKRIK
jgi:hypothetical protein